METGESGGAYETYLKCGEKHEGAETDLKVAKLGELFATVV